MGRGAIGCAVKREDRKRPTVIMERIRRAGARDENVGRVLRAMVADTAGAGGARIQGRDLDHRWPLFQGNGWRTQRVA